MSLLGSIGLYGGATFMIWMSCSVQFRHSMSGTVMGCM